MYFQPIDEMALRHLFSSRYGEDLLRMSYLGPVLSATGKRQDSPDCLILDRRVNPWRIRACEFKYDPCDKSAFAANGQFEVAIVWKIQSPSNKESLLEELKIQNGCQEILVLSQEAAFTHLDKYHIPELGEYNGIDKVEKVILKITVNAYPTAFAAYIAAKIYPKPFRIDKMVSVLANRFVEVTRMHPQGRTNVISKLMQTKPSLIECLYWQVYRWTSDINANEASKVIERLIRTRFRREVPDSEVITEFRTDMAN